MVVRTRVNMAARVIATMSMVVRAERKIRFMGVAAVEG
jgi:hypothetical protein